jgi:hypothetical protein
VDRDRGGGGPGAGAALALWLRRRRDRVAAVPEAPPIPAHEIALAALDRLAAQRAVGDAAVRRFYFALSEIVRAYIEGRFGLNATDLTTEEILRRSIALPLRRRPPGLRAFLHDTDRVKFAAHRPQRGEIAPPRLVAPLRRDDRSGRDRAGGGRERAVAGVSTLAPLSFEDLWLLWVLAPLFVLWAGALVPAAALAAAARTHRRDPVLDAGAGRAGEESRWTSRRPPRPCAPCA